MRAVRDLGGIESRVDWPTLRSNLKQTFAVYLEDKSPMPEFSAPSSACSLPLAATISSGGERPITFSRFAAAGRCAGTATGQ
jgi:hypothetical protein